MPLSEHIGRRSNDRGGYREKIRKYQDFREPSYDTSSVHESSASVTESGYTKSATTSMENLSRVMETTNGSWTSGSANSSVSNLSVEPISLANSIDKTRALLKKKSLVQIINNYIRAGIEEGKRQAKKYIRKALSFGVKSGYLIPEDPQGQVIRVSPTLAETRRSDPESRRRRRKARQGEDDLSFAERKERRRPTPPLPAKRMPRREASPDRMVPRKRRKTSATRYPGMNFNLNYAGQRKKDTEVARQENSPANKRRKELAKKKGQVIQKSSVTRRSETLRGKGRSTKQKDEVVERQPIRRNRPKKSTYASREPKGDIPRSREDLTDEEEDSTKSSDNDATRKIVTARRNSGSSEDGLADANAHPGNPTREVEERMELPTNDENDKNPIEDAH
ncbi:uncharacterized protein LOC116427344 [Nomia melanderi]|uniref:uncharacterized protein LOC116427344 n=1 Tax=Nomia melanderi TaxID=2448451 RepID=UPI00130448DA|nr:serine/arginine repetitive matrix protein 1-like [Nomia melanderi]